jgi:hypothetical protein
MQWGVTLPIPAAVPAFRNSRKMCGYDQGNRPSCTGLAKIQSSSAVGTAISVQKLLMRHSSITTTMDHYGEVVTDEMAQAHGKVVGLALNGAQTERKAN